MIKTLTDKDYIDVLTNDILDKPKIAIVKVSAIWCGPCKLLKTHYDRWAERFKDPDVVFYEIDNDSNPEFVNQYRIKSLPTMIFFVYGVDVYYLKGMTRQTVFEEVLNRTKQVRTEIEK